MAETPPNTRCVTCGTEVSGGQLLCPACLAAVGITEMKADAPASSDGDIRAGEPPVRRPQGNPPALEAPDIRTGPPTAVGCMLVLGCVAIIFGIAVPVVLWRDPGSGQGLPRMVAVAIPLLTGAICYAIGAGICSMLGVRLFKDRRPTPEDNADKPPTR